MLPRRASIYRSSDTGIPGYDSTMTEPTVDFFKDAGGYAGIAGLKGPLAPGTYHLNELLGGGKAKPVPVVPQYSPEQATQSLAQQLNGITNRRGGLLFPDSRKTPPPSNVAPQQVGNLGVNYKTGMQNPLSPGNQQRKRK